MFLNSVVVGRKLPVHSTAAALLASAASIAGTGNAGTTIGGTGALFAGASAVAGAGISRSTGTGALAAQPAVVVGAGSAGTLVAGSGALAAQSAIVAGSGKSSSTGTGALAAGAATMSGAGGGETYESPSYANAGGTGNRTSIITVTTNQSLGGSSGTADKLVNGGFANGSANAIWFVNAQSVVGKFVRFDFGHKAIITEAKWYQNGTVSGGQHDWKWQGSNDASSWSDLSSSFELNGGATGSVIGNLSANATGYRYYQLAGVSGNTNDSPWLWECEFKIGNII